MDIVFVSGALIGVPNDCKYNYNYLNALLLQGIFLLLQRIAQLLLLHLLVIAISHAATDSATAAIIMHISIAIFTPE